MDAFTKVNTNIRYDMKLKREDISKRVITAVVAASIVALMLVGFAACGKTATITFHSGTEEIVNPLDVTAGKKIGELPKPAERENYIFGGWFSDEEYKDKISEDTVVSADMDLYALWNLNMKPHTMQNKIWIWEMGNCYAIDSEGRLYEWGRACVTLPGEPEKNNYRYRPKQIIEKVRFSSTRGYVSIDVDGNIWSVYGNPFDIDNTSGPMQLTSGTRFIQAEYTQNLSGAWQLLAIDEEGYLWVKGNEKKLQKFMTNNRFAEISVAEEGNSYLCYALDTKGILWAWGSNYDGNLGGGMSGGIQSTAIQIGMGKRFVSVCTSGSFTYALDAGGNLWSWGVNGGGFLGDGTTTHRKIPHKTPCKTKFVNLSKWGFAIDENGGLWGWGNNSSGRLGNGSTETPLAPVPLIGDTGFVSVSSYGSASLALDKDGNLWSWGNNSYGQRGDGTGTENFIPTKNELCPKVVEAALGQTSTYVIDDSGRLWATGSNNGCLGNGENKVQTLFVPINETIKYDIVVSGQTHTLAIDKNGCLWAWGYNSYGKLGTGDKENRSVPERIADGVKFVQAAAGDSHSVAIDENGDLWAWGRNESGQLGNGTKTNLILPTKTVKDKNLVKVAAGSSHTLMLDADGYLWMCGSSIGGAGLEVNSETPVKVSETVKFAEISSGFRHSLAIDEKGNLWTWGTNGSGQIGTGSNISEKLPVKIDINTRFSCVSAGRNYSLAIDKDGNLWAWGANGCGQLGNGNRGSLSVPTKITEGIKFDCVYTSIDFSMAIDENGECYFWGMNNGTFGNGISVRGIGLAPVIIKNLNGVD